MNELRSFENPTPTFVVGDGVFSALASGDEVKIAEARTEFENQPGVSQESVEALFGLVGFLKVQEEIEITKQWDEKVSPEFYRDQTEYNFLLTHTISEGFGSRESLFSFWESLKRVAETRGDAALETFKSLRKGVITQVGLARVLEALGEHPELATPDEDAYDATDMWVRGKPVQIKGKKTDTPAFVPTEEISFPAASVGTGKNQRYYTSQLAHDFSSFRFKVKKYGERVGRPLTGYFAVVPHDQVDPVTGEPTPELIEQFRALYHPDAQS